MGRRRRPLPIWKEIEIEDTAAEGKSLARVNEQVVFVPQTVPGDVVDIQLTRKRKKFAEGRAIKFHRYSPDRVEPFCQHFGTCGGCKWQFLPYELQLKNKEKWVRDSFSRIGKVAASLIQPILPSEETRFYRNKLEFTFSNKAWITEEQVQSGEVIENRDALGFHIPGRFDKILEIDKCWLQEEPSNAIRNWVGNYAREHKLPFFDLREQTGLMRNLIIRTTSIGEVMVIFSFFRQDDKIATLLKDFCIAFPTVYSIMYVINEKKNDTISDQEILCFKGKDHIIEQMQAYDSDTLLQFKIDPKSFYQTNSRQAEKLYELAASMAGIQSGELVYDLYTGTGTIANYVAHLAEKVVGIEYVPEAIEDARNNSEINGISNTTFFAGDMKDLLTEEFISQQGKPEVIITDPPRAGMHADVVKQLLSIETPRIVYISCNPATQARDIELLSEKYKLIRARPVDMFPHTHHVENVALLELK